MARIDTDLLGLQIVALDNAMVVGEIDGLLIDDASRKVAGFLVDLGLYEASVLPFGSARAIGRDAVIVESTDMITDISANPTLEVLAEKDVAISDARAITRSGRTVGTIGDFYVDTVTGDVVGLELLASDQMAQGHGIPVVPASVVYRLGADIVVLEDDYEKHLLREGSALGAGETIDSEESVPAAEPEPTESEVPPIDTPALLEEPAQDTGGPQTTAEPEADTETALDSEPEVAAPEPPPSTADTATVSGPEETPAEAPSHFLVGKRVLRRIETPSGEVIAEAGDAVTFEMVQKAKASDQLLILSLNVE